MTKTGAFALGVITGIAALGVTAILVESRNRPYLCHIQRGNDLDASETEDDKLF